MGDKIEQTAEATDGSTVNQAAHDIHNHYGPKMLDIIQTIDYQVSRQFEGLLYKHAPVLIQNEILKVESSINEFKEKLSSKISDQFETLKSSLTEDVAGEKLIKGVTDSNFQYLFKDSLEQVIRKKEDAPQDVLVSLLINKIKNLENNSDYLIEEAIEALKYINKNHVNFILFEHLILGNLKIPNTDNKETIENIKMFSFSQIKWIVTYFLKLEPTPIDLDYLSYKGLIRDDLNYINHDTIPESIIKYALPESLANEIPFSSNDILEIFLPELKILLDKFGLKDPYKFRVLSKISTVIAEKCSGDIAVSIEECKNIDGQGAFEWLSSIINELKKRGYDLSARN